MCVNVASTHSDKARLTSTDEVTGVTDEHTLQAYVHDFASKTRTLAATGVEILKLVEKAPQVLLGDENFVKMQDAAQKLLGVYTEVPKGNSNHPGSSQPRHTDAAKECDATNDNEKGYSSRIADNAFWKDLVTLAAIDDILKAVEQRERFMRIHCEGPSYSLDLGLSFDDEIADDNHDQASVANAYVNLELDRVQPTIETMLVVDAQIGYGGDDVRVSPRPKRPIKATSAMKSPYKQRAVDVVKKLDGHEKMIVNWILKNDVTDGDLVIFQSSGYSVKKAVVECLLPNTPVTNELLALWSCILNYSENLKSRGAATCFFASTSPCNELFFDGKRRKEVSYKKFAQSLDSEIARMSIYQLKQISMFLFPVHPGMFSGLLCVAPESQKYTILDSAGNCKDVSVKKALMSRAELLQQSISKYLGERNLSRSSKSVGLAIPDVVDMAWIDGVDKADVGVITMRHMETFKGVVGKSWNPQLKIGDKVQMKLMRKRYIYVIACAPNNALKEINLSEAKRFHPVYLTNKQHITS